MHDNSHTLMLLSSLNYLTLLCACETLLNQCAFEAANWSKHRSCGT